MIHLDWIRRQAERTPDRLAQVDLATDRRFTYAQMNDRANRLASFLRDEMGIERGNRISILAKNSTDYFEVLFACGRIGAILNTLNWRLAVPELQYIIDDCRPDLLFYEPEFGEQAAALRPGSTIDNAVVMSSEEAPAADWIYEEALATGSPADFEGPSLQHEDVWAILYTSGTTGRPKGAMLTYGNFLYNAIGAGRAIDATSRDVNLVALPTFHVGGLGLYACPTFHAGGAVVVMRSFDPEALLSAIETWRVTTILLVPAMYLMLRDHPAYGNHDLSSMRVWSSGGSPLPPSLVEQYAEGGIVIQQGMGMTETAPTIFLIPREDAVRKAGSVGKPVLHTDVCIMDRDGNRLGPGEVGELCIRGNIIPGYWNEPDRTAETIRDGWLHSGDAARYDDQGFYYIVDRWKDMYISGGENVYPAEIEKLLYEHPAIAEVAVIGVPHPRWQETGRAIVVVKEGATLTEKDVVDFCEGKLARYKIPRSVVFVDALPRNDIGKVEKVELRSQYGETVE